jgi:hypothetical protein
MNPTDENLPTIDQSLFDLLVDGELSDAQRRDLLAKLEAAPGGWRRCALAFLEAQCWREELRSVTPYTAPRPKASAASRRQVRSWGKGATLLAMAASFLIALGLGVFLRDAWHTRGQIGPGTTQFAAVKGPQDRGAGSEARESLPPDSFPEPGSPMQYVTLPLAGGPEGAAESIRLPAAERESIDRAWLESLPTAMPADFLEALRRSGHRVRQQRGLLPFPMEDGRQLVVPFDEVDVRYVGNPAYQ